MGWLSPPPGIYTNGLVNRDEQTIAISKDVIAFDEVRNRQLTIPKSPKFSLADTDDAQTGLHWLCRGDKADGPIMTEAASVVSSPPIMERGGLATGMLEAGPEASLPSQLISFAIGDDHFGVDIMAVREIKGWTEITPLPRQPDYVRGVLNLRGIIVPIIDLRCRFGQGLTHATPMHIVIIVQIGEKPIGLLADRVLDIVSLDARQVKPVPRLAQAQRLAFLSGLVTTEETMIALIDLNYVLSPQDGGDGEHAADGRTALASHRN